MTWDGVTLAAALAMTVSGCLAIAGASTGRRALERVFKPLTTLLLFPVLGWPSGSTKPIIALGICLSLVGDVALLWKSDRAFLRGLCAFLAAQLAYVAGFARSGRWSPFAAAALAGVGVVGAVGLRVLWPRVHRLRIPIVAYVLALSGMVVSAASAVTCARPSTEWALVGAVLFYASDGCLAWNRFVRPLRGGAFLILLLYWLGQFSIAVGSRAIGAGEPRSSKEVPCRLCSRRC